MNKCILKEAWSDIKTLLIASTVVIAFITTIFLVLVGIGYVSAQWFDLCLEVSGSSPMLYYGNNGGLILLFTVFILLIIIFPFFILYNIYSWIKNLKHRCK